MAFKNIILESKDGIGFLKLNRPEVLNALNRETYEELMVAADSIIADSSLRVLVITGVGRAFSSGGDRSEHPVHSWGGNVQVISEVVQRYYRGIILKVFELNIPTIAMVNGVATGWGFELSLACDMRIGSENTRFMVAFTRVGLTPAAGGAWLLPRVVGISKAMEIILTARFVEAQEAAQLGILNKVVPAAELEKETMALARQISQNSPLANRLVKLQIHKGMNYDLSTALEFGATCQSICQTSEYTTSRFTNFGDKK